MPKLLPLFALSLLLFSCGGNPDSEQDFNTKVLREGDVPWVRPTDCRAHIAQATCIVSSASRECQGDNSAYVRKFEALYDRYPASLQKMFCSLRKLYVETDINSTAYAQRLVQANGRPAPGANIGIRKSILDQGLAFATWSSWKEQLSFGGQVSAYLPVATLPHYSVAGADDLDLFLYFVITHEFGHLFDFANDVNRSPQWPALSWAGGRPNSQNDFAGRGKFCFYGCSSYASANEANDLYGALDRTNFLNSYAATNPHDDFAESVAFYFADLHLTQKLSLHTSRGLTFSMSGKVHAPQFAPKLRFVQDFFANPGVAYP